MSLESTPLYAGNADFLDTLYEQYQRDPASVAVRWRALFDSWGAAAPAEPPG
jgi:2-oxoglutarate dehydrogenase E1 component